MFLVSDILDDEEFLKIRECKHHGLNRLDHSIKVSYYSYLVTKKLGLNYEATARGGLLHDFFTGEELSKSQQKLKMVFHPYASLSNSSRKFELSEMEKDIIINHMFPTLPHKIPKFIESWIVSLVDKVVAVREFYESYGRILMYRLSNIYLMLLILR